MNNNIADVPDIVRVIFSYLGKSEAIKLEVSLACKKWNEIAFQQFNPNRIVGHCVELDIHMTPFLWACRNGNLDTIKRFLSHNKLCSFKNMKEHPRHERDVWISDSGNEELACAAYGGKLDAMKLLLANFNWKLENCNSMVLRAAASSDSAETFKFCLDATSNREYLTKRHLVKLIASYIGISGTMSSLDYYRQRIDGADDLASYESEAVSCCMMKALECGNRKIVDDILKDETIKFTKQEYYMIMGIACSKGMQKAVFRMVSRGFVVSTIENVTTAIASGNLKCIRNLLTDERLHFPTGTYLSPKENWIDALLKHKRSQKQACEILCILRHDKRCDLSSQDNRLLCLAITKQWWNACDIILEDKRVDLHTPHDIPIHLLMRRADPKRLLKYTRGIPRLKISKEKLWLLLVTTIESRKRARFHVGENTFTAEDIPIPEFNAVAILDEIGFGKEDRKETDCSPLLYMAVKSQYTEGFVKRICLLDYPCKEVKPDKEFLESLCGYNVRTVKLVLSKMELQKQDHFQIIATAFILSGRYDELWTIKNMIQQHVLSGHEVIACIIRILDDLGRDDLLIDLFNRMKLDQSQFTKLIRSLTEKIHIGPATILQLIRMSDLSLDGCWKEIFQYMVSTETSCIMRLLDVLKEKNIKPNWQEYNPVALIINNYTSYTLKKWLDHFPDIDMTVDNNWPLRHALLTSNNVLASMVLNHPSVSKHISNLSIPMKWPDEEGEDDDTSPSDQHLKDKKRTLTTKARKLLQQKKQRTMIDVGLEM